MAYAQSSGTTNFNPFASDIAIDAFERIGIYAPDGKHMQSCRRSLNLLLASDWSNKGANLWKFFDVSFPLIPGVIQYNLTRDVVSVYDCYRRQYQMNGPQSFPVDFTTLAGSTEVMIKLPGQSVPVGSYIGVQIPVSVGGLIIYGFYQVISNPTPNSVAIDASAGTNPSPGSLISGLIPLLIGSPVPAGSTVASLANSNVVTVHWVGHGLGVGANASFLGPIQVGGLTLGGVYSVITVTDANNFTINATFNATANATVTVPPLAADQGGAAFTVLDGGVVPQFSTQTGSPTVTVSLPYHHYDPGQPFPVVVPLTVGGVTLVGSYPVQSVLDANTFTITANAKASSNASLFENNGQALIALQNQAAPYSDILLGQLSRDDYAGQANKTASGPPTSLWVNKQIVPQVSVWPVTDNTGPYELHMWCMKQVEDVNPSGGQTLDLPPRFYYALVTDLARDLAVKFAPDKYTMLKTEADAAWQRAQSTDVEPTSTYIVPNLPTGL